MIGPFFVSFSKKNREAAEDLTSFVGLAIRTDIESQPQQ